MAGLRAVIETQGVFCSLYSDRGSHFFVTAKAGEKVDKHRLTLVGRAMKDLGIRNNSRLLGTGAGTRGTKLWDLAGAAAAGTAAGWRPNAGGGQSGPARTLHCCIQREVYGAGGGEGEYVPADHTEGSGLGFTVQTERVVGKDNTVAIGDRLWQLDKTRFRATLAGCTVTTHEHLDGRIPFGTVPTSSAATKPMGRALPEPRRTTGRAVEKPRPPPRRRAVLPTNPAQAPFGKPKGNRRNYQLNRTDHVCE